MFRRVNYNFKEMLMLTQRDRKAQYRQIENLRKLRVANLRILKDKAGSWLEFSRQTGHTESFLCHICGPNPRRDVGEKLARGIELALKLPSGWLDQKHA